MLGLNIPGGQGTQEDLPCSLLKLPAGQSVGEVLLLGQKWPMGHIFFVESVEAGSQKNPGGHEASQATARLLLMLVPYLPAGQGYISLYEGHQNPNGHSFVSIDRRALDPVSATKRSSSSSKKRDWGEMNTAFLTGPSVRDLYIAVLLRSVGVAPYKPLAFFVRDLMV